MPHYRTEPLERYLHDAAAGEPTPGGGSVSALVGALASTMASMAGNFTVGKKKYSQVQTQVAECPAAIEATREDLLRLMQQDTEAYACVSEAYGLPKSTPEEKQARTQAIQAALAAAMEPPLATVRACAVVVAESAKLVDIANLNLITDVGVAAALGEAALRAAKLNVDINLASIQDEGLVARTRAEVSPLAAAASAAARETLAKVEQAIGAGE